MFDVRKKSGSVPRNNGHGILARLKPIEKKTEVISYFFLTVIVIKNTKNYVILRVTKKSILSFYCLFQLCYVDEQCNDLDCTKEADYKRRNTET